MLGLSAVVRLHVEHTDNAAEGSSSGVALLIVGLMAFLTLVDLFAAQAILPSLVQRYQTTPGAMGIAVNACTFGMAVASLAVAFFSMHVERRTGIAASLALLALPTALLAHAPDLTSFALLRIAQGMCMATAFTLTLSHLGDRFRGTGVAAASAAYITGNVASNFVGRMVSAALADHVGLTWTFYAFATLNIAGALLAAYSIGIMRPGSATSPDAPMVSANVRFGDRALIAAYGIGFCILFAFIGTFTYINFVLTRSPLSIGQMQLGFIYLVFLPSVLTTPLAGLADERFGTRPTLLGSLLLAGLGLPPLLWPSLWMVIGGLALVAIGTFLAQATAIGFVSRTMAIDRGMASGFYLGSYFMGGLVGAAVLGQVFDSLGWPACVAGIAVALGGAGMLGKRL